MRQLDLSRRITDGACGNGKKEYLFFRAHQTKELSKE
jgi:hypothetical protein